MSNSLKSQKVVVVVFVVGVIGVVVAIIVTVTFTFLITDHYRRHGVDGIVGDLHQWFRRASLFEAPGTSLIEASPLEASLFEGKFHWGCFLIFAKNSRKAGAWNQTGVHEGHARLAERKRKSPCV